MFFLIEIIIVIIVFIIVYKILKLKNIVVVMCIGLSKGKGMLKVICVKKFLDMN